MKVRPKLLFVALVATILAGPFSAIGGHREGTGGDFLRASFIRMGQAVVQHLRDTDDGRRLVADHGLDLDALAATLTIDVVKVSDLPLRDNGDSVVDAIGTPGSITLAHDAWAEYFEHERDVYFLVLHEMLRAASVNDDNYVISGDVRPFPANERVATSILMQEPLIDGEDVASYVDTANLAVAGSGCPSGFGTLIDVDSNRNVLELRVKDFTVYAGPGVPMAERRRNCQVIVPIKTLPPHTRLVITQVDAQAELDLPKGSSFTLTSKAYFSGSASTIAPTKTVAATTARVKGRTLLRASGNLLSNGCNAPARGLVINLSGFATPGSGNDAGEATGHVLGSSLYLQLRGC